MSSLRRVPSTELTPAELGELRDLLWRTFGDDPETGFSEADWLHAIGGWHALVEQGGRMRAHGSVILRTLEIDGEPWASGYVEAIATDPSYQGQGIGTEIMTAIDEIIVENYELGALGTGSFHFYERLGWRRWEGPLGVRTPFGVERTPEDDGHIMVLFTEATAHLDLGGLITCDWRAGDVW